MDDVAFALGIGDRAPTASTGEGGESGPGGVPRVALALVPVFVATGVAAGFLAARRLRERAPDTAADPADGSIAVEVSTGEQ